MPDYSPAARKKINAISADEHPVTLLEIEHPDLPEPIRVVNWSEDITHAGNVFTALAYEITLPGDLAQGLPRASLSIDNIGRELTDWIEASNGARGTTCRLIQVLPSDPDTIEWDITMNLENPAIDVFRVTAALTYDDLLNLPAVALVYSPQTAPGLY